MNVTLVVMNVVLKLLILIFLIENHQTKNVDSYSCLGLQAELSVADEVDDNTFQIYIENEPKIYEPYEKYVVVLKSTNINIRFKEFNLLAESLEPAKHKQQVGRFERFAEALTKFSNDCPNGVTQSSLLLKQEIRVIWVAPPSGSGCVKFRAAVRSLDVWLTNQNTMSLVICEESQALDGQPKILLHCNACNEAKYGIEFTGLWSRNTHPKDYPSNSWDTAFSNIIGASHSNDYNLFTKDHVASDALKQLAEEGNIKYLAMQMSSHNNAKNIRTIIKARGLKTPYLHGKTYAEFRVDREHHLMSLVSKLIPSPDWFIGVDSLELCQPNGSWIDEKQMNLYLWDAGTDAGVSYVNPYKYPLKAKDKIVKITNFYPAIENSPFYNLNETKIKPFARIKVFKERIFNTNKACRIIQPVLDEDEDNDSLENSFVNGAANFDLNQAERTHEIEEDLDKQENSKTFDNIEYKNSNDDFSIGNAYKTNQNRKSKNYHNKKEIELEDKNSNEHNCATYMWSDWSECKLNENSNCGWGFSYRTRKLVEPNNLPYCNYVLLDDSKKCEILCQSNDYNNFNSNPSEIYNMNPDYDRNAFISHPRSKLDFSSSEEDEEYKVNKQESNSFANQNRFSLSETNQQAFYNIPENCKLSEWSEFSSCFGDCRTFKYRNRTRTLITFEQNCLNIPLIETSICMDECRHEQNSFQKAFQKLNNFRNQNRALKQNAKKQVARNKFLKHAVRLN